MYWLPTDKISFPDPRFAPQRGLLAAGGDLQPQRILFAYENGIFPWYSEGEPILWWSPDPRFVLYPNEIHISKNMRKLMRKKVFDIKFDTDFNGVIQHCAQAPRKGQAGTWLVPEMIKAYEKLHNIGLAHSVEAWQDGVLVGGLYGLSLGRCFFGESMFTKVSNSSKACLIHLSTVLQKNGFDLIDCQSYTPHLERLGARFISREAFLNYLQDNKKHPNKRGKWHDFNS